MCFTPPSCHAAWRWRLDGQRDPTAHRPHPAQRGASSAARSCPSSCNKLQPRLCTPHNLLRTYRQSMFGWQLVVHRSPFTCPTACPHGRVCWRCRFHRPRAALPALPAWAVAAPPAPCTFRATAHWTWTSSCTSWATRRASATPARAGMRCVHVAMLPTLCNAARLRQSDMHSWPHTPAVRRPLGCDGQ